MKPPHVILALSLAGIATAPAVEVANSLTQFTTDGSQGTDGWFNGYRNYTVDGGGEDYDPAADFIPFDIAAWDGAKFDLGAGAPWTEIAAEGGHPNGTNNLEEHWCIRRWVADVDAPLAVTYHLRETNDGGSGVGGSVHVNGVRLDGAATDNTTGFTRTVYVNAAVGDAIDVALTPVGPSGDGSDGSDGSAFSMVIDDEVNDVETQPDGRLFIASDAVDSEPDGLADAWEEIYSPGDLSQLIGDGVADFDSDGLSDLQEQQFGTDPTLEDTDGDGLEDFEEFDEHNTDPLVADSDGDGLSDGDEVNVHLTDPLDTDSDADGYDDGREVALGTDPNDGTYTPETDRIANSEAEFSGEQGLNNWSYGYRNYTTDGGGEDYNPSSGFIPFAGGSAGGAWDGTTQQWTGTAWDLSTSGAPWTLLQATGTHPNGTNNVDEHWTIRRWTAPDFDTITPIAIMWHTRKANTANDGVSGSVHLNGVQIDKQTIPGTDTTGVYRVVYANALPGARIDLALTPEGINNRTDGSDSSNNWMWISTRIPENPTQPDGSPFVPSSGSDTDADNLPDEWEEQFSPGDLTQLSGLGDADFDMDGLTDLEELSEGTDPTDNDSDDDTLTDGDEVNTHGTSPIAADTDGDGRADPDEINGAGGFTTDPTLADSDGDGLTDGAEIDVHGTDPTEADTDEDGDSDGYEVARRFDPTDPEVNSATLLADSFEGFSQVQGQDDWNHGYRNLTLDGGAVDSYDPVADFIPFDEVEHWRPNWRLVPTNAPWTFLGQEACHPNGINNTEEHWVIRRWTADALAATTPLGLRTRINVFWE